MKWEIKKLADCCVSIADGDHQPPPKAQKGIPFVTISNITTANQFDFTNTMYVSEEYYNHLDSKRKPQRGDILYSVVGSFGIPVYIKETIPFVFQRHIAVLRPNHTILPQFLYYTMLNRDFYLMADAAAIGAAQRTVSLSALRNMKIAVPPINIQEKIVYLLSAYDNLIENNQRQIRLLEEVAQRLYKEWFVDLRFPGYGTTPVVDGLPEGWGQRSLGDVASVLKRGISPKYDDSGKYLVISQKCIRQSIMDIGEARRESKEYAPELNLQDKDTVICSTGTGTLGRVGQVFGGYPDTTFDSHVTLVRTEQYQNFFYQAIKHQQDFLMSMGRGSTNQQELYRGVIENLRILTPTQEILNKAESLFSTIHDKITALNSQIGLLVEARDRLLPKLMSGEVEVKSQRHKGVIP